MWKVFDEYIMKPCLIHNYNKQNQKEQENFYHHNLEKADGIERQLTRKMSLRAGSKRFGNSSNNNSKALNNNSETPALVVKEEEGP